MHNIYIYTVLFLYGTPHFYPKPLFKVAFEFYKNASLIVITNNSQTDELYEEAREKLLAQIINVSRR